ncbi:hypothetical protein ACIBHY_10650 [Nonomuraea sp. NPDC050547]|uniref:hypothetical protein n=1 Tax=Nonomuraea sp. NPDC050547 TaxID=3364368 RepID=UPI0037AA668C
MRAITADASTVVTGGGTFAPVVRVWDLRTRRERGPPLSGFSRQVSHVALSGDLIIAAGDGGKRTTPRFWDRAGASAHPPGRLLDLEVTRLYGGPVAPALGRSAVWVIDLATGTREADLTLGTVRGDPGRLGALVTGMVGCVPVAVIERDGMAVVVNLATGRPLGTPFDLRGESWPIVLGLGGGLLAAADHGGRAVHAVFGVTTGQSLTGPWM